MLRKAGLIFLVGVLITSLSTPVVAQDGINATASYNLNMRAGPGAGYAAITTLQSGADLVLEARSADNAWALAHTPDSAYRGWVAALYLYMAPGFSFAALPVSSEIVDVAQSEPVVDDVPKPPPDAAGQAAPQRATVAAGPLTLREGPGTQYARVGRLFTGTALVPQGRDGAAAWVLVQTDDGTQRGWVAVQYVRFEGGYAVNLPQSDEIVATTTADAPPPPPPAMGGGRKTTPKPLPSLGHIDLNAYPVVPTGVGQSHTIYATGLARGNSPNVIAKVGDCASDHPYFLEPFAQGQYSLGSYGHLQGVIDRFGGSFTLHSQAAYSGFVADAVIDPQWANPEFCGPGESALQCEYRLHRPSVAIIMFGLTDLQRRSPQQFYDDLREVVQQSINAGVIPVLNTFPPHLAFADQTILYNQIVVQVATEYNVPLVNFWRAVQPLTNFGMDADGTHLSGYHVFGPAHFVPENMDSGFVMRNLVTLQALDVIMRAVMG